jgi:hypothetical protein
MTAVQLMQAIAVVAVSLGIGVGIAWFLTKRELGRILTAVDRIPGEDWFTEVKADLRRVTEHGNHIFDHERRLKDAERALADGRERFREHDKKLADLFERMAHIEARAPRVGGVA